MFPRKIFWKFTYCSGYFSTSWTIFRRILIELFASNSECFTKYDAFCSYISDYACLGRKAYCYRKSSKLWKTCIHQKHVWKLLMGNAFSTSPLPFWIRLCSRPQMLCFPPWRSVKSKKIKVFRYPVVTSVYFCNCRRAAQNRLAGRMLPTPAINKQLLLLEYKRMNVSLN